MKQLSYRTMLRKEPEGGYTLTVPSLPGCVTYGENIDHAILMAKEAVALYVESLEAHVVIPLHTGDLPKGTLFEILKQADISRDEWDEI